MAWVSCRSPAATPVVSLPAHPRPRLRSKARSHLQSERGPSSAGMYIQSRQHLTRTRPRHRRVPSRPSCNHKQSIRGLPENRAAGGLCVYFNLQNDRPFSNAISSFFRGNVPLSLYSNGQVSEEVGIDIAICSNLPNPSLSLFRYSCLYQTLQSRCINNRSKQSSETTCSGDCVCRYSITAVTTHAATPQSCSHKQPLMK